MNARQVRSGLGCRPQGFTRRSDARTTLSRANSAFSFVMATRKQTQTLLEVSLMWRSFLLGFVIAGATPVFADPPELVFKPAGEGLYDFNTGAFQGRLKVDGKYQGIYPMVHLDSKMELVHAPGVFSFYRVLGRNERWGDAARDWPTQTRPLKDGAVEVHWPPAPDHPVEITGIYRWKRPDTLDLEIAFTPQREIAECELFMSSYFTKTFRASVYLRGSGDEPARWVPVDRTPRSTRQYVMFPRDEAAVKRIQDGRWKIGSSPVDWEIERSMAAALILRRDTRQGLTAVVMSPPGDCFAVASPWNPATPEAAGYRSIYLSLLGRDLRAGETARARCRLVIAKLTDQEALQRYQDYLRELK